MRSRLVVFLLLALIMLPVQIFAASNGNSEPPLTLLQKPGKSTQSAPQQSISSQDKELHDIHGPVPITEPPPYLLIGGCIVLLLLVAAAMYWFLRKRTKPAPLPLPPWEKALLDLAEAQKMLRPERALVYMDRVSQILRSYIESRFAIQSTRQTTREFLQGVTGISNSPLRAHKTELQTCLEQADMAKFAHHIPEIQNLQQMEQAITTFIKKTEPADPPNKSMQQKTAKPGKQSKPSKNWKRGRS